MSDVTEDERNAMSPVIAPLHEDETAFTAPIGVIGLGTTGLPLALRLAEQRAVLACDIDPVRLALLAEHAGAAAGVHTTPVATEVAERCAVIALVLPTEDAGSVLASLSDRLRPGTAVIHLGIAPPAETRRQAEALAERGVDLVDAPLTGSAADARNGALSLFVGGAEAAIDRAMPVLQALAGDIVRLEGAGAAHAAHALHCLVEAASVLAAAEASRIAEAAEHAADLPLSPAVRNSRPHLWVMEEALRAASTLAAETGIASTALTACLKAWRRAMDEFGPGAEEQEVRRVVGQSDAA